MMKDLPHGLDLLRDPVLNKGTAFTEEERSALKLRGLLPPRVFTLQEQELRVLGNYHRKTSNLEKYIFSDITHMDLPAPTAGRFLPS